ncbi:MAG TPA: TIGR03668 family PPOX class F420-dependent oxidoreductase [Beutenbergiaceae bacterium]|nr:TIGR03668 family PPOX class F420-dependent oxidoreductase [Beutenbergiaceae bacterium]
MDLEECRRRFATAPRAHLATIRSDGPAPHLVPVTFAVSGERIVVAVDHKPKRTSQLQRLRNIEANPRVSFLADHYSPDWSQLWWVRADAHAQVVHDGGAHQEAIAHLCRRYSQYRERPPAGPVIVATVTAWRGWSHPGST